MEVLHSDNGSEFVNETMKHLCEWLGIRRSTTTPYHPQGSGMCERANEAIERAITAMVIAHDPKWHEALPLALWCIRSAINSSTGYSPYEVLHGTRMTMPYDFRVQNDDGAENYFNKYVEQLVIRMNSVYSKVQEHMAEANRKHKRAYDRSARLRTFSVVDQVLIRAMRPPNDVAQGEKFYPHWSGPYKVVFAYSNHVSYRLADPKDPSDTWIEHVNNMKKYLAPRNVSAESGIPPLAETISDVSSVSMHKQKLLPAKSLTPYTHKQDCHRSSSHDSKHGAACAEAMSRFPPRRFRLAEIIPQPNFCQPWRKIVDKAESAEPSQICFRTAANVISVFRTANTSSQATKSLISMRYFVW